MPTQKTRHKISSGARKSADRGSGRKIRRRRQPRQRKVTSTQPIGTLYTVELKQKSGTEVFFTIGEKLEDFNGEKPSPGKLYEGLLESLQIAAKLFDYKQPISNQLRELLGYQTALDYVIRTFKEVIPVGYDFNIEYVHGNDKHPYQFVIYRELENLETLSIFEIKDTVLKLARHHKKLHDLFISFLAIYYRKCDTMFWFRDEYPIDWMKDNIKQIQGQDEEETIAQEKACIHEYTKGNAKKYEGLIRTSKKMDVDQLLAANNRFEQKHPIVQLIKNGCELLKEPYNVENFVYDAFITDEYNDTGLRYYRQNYVAWDTSDSHYQMAGEFIDCDANEGIIPPCIHAYINKDTRKDLQDWLFNATDWPRKLDNFTTMVNEQMIKYL